MLVYKPCGILGTAVANKYKEQLNKKKVTLCGKLDILARGLLLLLFDEDCKTMEENLGYRKIYKFKILWGIETDTTDALGLIKSEVNITNNMINSEYINDNMEEFVGKYRQKFHNYSAKYMKNNDGERHSMWQWSNLDRLNEIEIPDKEVNVKYINQMETEKRDMKAIRDEILDNIKNVEGKYRQELIREQWKGYDNNNDMYITEFEADVSSGFYIRQLIKEFGNKTGLKGIAIDIYRTKIDI